MGVTRQAAQKRFVPKESADLDPNQDSAATPSAPRNVVVTAHNRAKSAGNAETVPEHLVLGLLAEPEALAAKAIAAQGSRWTRCSRRRPPPAPRRGRPELVPYSPAAKKSLELTFREALRLGHNYIGTEHILLALLEQRERRGPADGLGISKDATEAHVLKALDDIRKQLSQGD